MTWVKDGLRQQHERRNTEWQETQIAVNPPEQSFKWQPTWDRINATIKDDLQEFNDARGAQFQPSWGDLRVQVIPKQQPFDTAILEMDEQTGTIILTCPIDHPGLPRRGTFKISGEHISSQEDFVGEPKPPTEPMTPAEFSEFVLKPLLFPVD